jgi:MoxR-like ATPase
MTQIKQLKFEGKNPLKAPANAHPDSWKTPEPYIATERLKTAVNLTISLHRPLLIEGDPGCGKTCLAKAVAFELGLPFFRWNVESVTKARDGLYVYDALGRLHDVQLKNGNSEPTRNPSQPEAYCEMGAIGKAFNIKNCTSVILIDEIDKAELDFPNDLLTVLDKPWEFQIRESGRTVQANPEHIPIVFITSNKEKGNLPDAFLRRCLYHYVEFPGNEQTLKEILALHFQLQEQTPPDTDLQDAAIEKFLAVRNEGGLIKKPGTSEFLDWLKALYTFGERPYEAQKLLSDSRLPYRELLLKIQQDWRKFEPAT